MNQNKVVIKTAPIREHVSCGDIYQVVDSGSALNGTVYIVACVLDVRGVLSYNLISLNGGIRFTCEYNTHILSSEMKGE